MITKADIIREGTSVMERMVILRKCVNDHINDADIADKTTLVHLFRNLHSLAIDIRNATMVLNETHQALLREQNKIEIPKQIAEL